jgi:hypothetical protein
MYEVNPLGPTQTRHPWRATVRTIFAAGVALLTLLPVIAATAGVDTVPAIAQVLVVAGAVTRVLALPGVERFLELYIPWLAASPAEGIASDLFDIFGDDDDEEWFR